MQQFRVVVAGGRDFSDFNLLCKKLDNLLQKKRLTHDIVIVSGKARGADSLGEKYARMRGYSVIEMPANWDEYGKSAGYRRNEDMALASNATVAFWDGKSRGTKHMIDLTKKYQNLLRVVEY